MNMVSITIDGQQIRVPEKTTVLEAAKQIGVYIPTLCYLKDVNEFGACRMCLVEVEGVNRLLTSCILEATEGMKIKTNTKAIREARKANLGLILSNHDRKCLTCTRNTSCELQALCDDLGIREIDFDGAKNTYDIDFSSPSIVRDNNKCILCGRCVAVCDKVQHVGILGFKERGFKTYVGQPFDKDLSESPCIACGQCINVCPVGALHEKEEIDVVWNALSDPGKHVVVQTAPAVRAALGEEFGLEMGTPCTGKMAAALRRMGFHRVFDTDFAADLTIMEEGTELLNRIQNQGVLPMITSCSPGWINYCEHFYPEFIPNLSSCKSPHEMMGAVLKSYYAEQQKIDPKDLFVVSVMPCTAKKFEAKREELSRNGLQDVDAVITTRELAKMIKEARIDFNKLPEEDFDPVLGESTGAAVIFGTTGGVMEAALRTVYEVLTGKTLQNVEFEAVRGLEGIKEATIKIDDLDVNVAVAHSTGQAAKLLDMIKAGEKSYHFIEIMGCPGGCVTGGGQPIVNPEVRQDVDVKMTRAKALYTEDSNKKIRKSHENPMIKKIYEEYFEAPNSHKAHEILHTHYQQKENYPL